MPARAAVLGQPIAHSKSPALHRAAYASLGVDAEYGRQEVSRGGLDAFVSTLDPHQHWLGLSVTMPLKEEAAARADSLAGAAATLGVVNTLVFSEHDGARTLTGYNTDVVGMINALRFAGLRECHRGAIIGGGGTAAAAVAALVDLGATEVDVYVRDTARAAAVLLAAARLGQPIRVLDLKDAGAALATYDAVISTLPPKGADWLATQLVRGPEHPLGALLDVAYDPWPSEIASVWESNGGAVTLGLEMLLYQAVEQVKLFTGCSVPGRGPVIDTMCDAVGLPRRGNAASRVAG